VKRESVGRAETSYFDVIYRQLSGDKTKRLKKTNANMTAGRPAEIQSGDFTNVNPCYILKANGRRNKWKESTNKINKTLRRRNNEI